MTGCDGAHSTVRSGMVVAFEGTTWTLNFNWAGMQFWNLPKSVTFGEEPRTNHNPFTTSALTYSSLYVHLGATMLGRFPALVARCLAAQGKL